jgi:hypothetical protein
VNSGATLGGNGGTVKAATINAGGTLSPGAAGASIGTFAINNGLTFNGGGTLNVDLDTTNVLNDVVTILVGDLNLGVVAPKLQLNDLGGNVALSNDTKFTLITYSGAWDGHLFSFAGNPVADDSTFIFGANTYRLDYNDGGNSVSLTVVPEPGAAMTLIGGAAMLLGLRRRRMRA